MANRERMRLLVDALRSGEYEKGTERLHRRFTDEDGTVHDKWCCLGVGTDVAIKNGADITRRMVPCGDGCECEVFDDEPEEILCDAAVRWFGLPEHDVNPDLKDENGQYVGAPGWNDYGHDASVSAYSNTGPEPDFERIADAFERTYLS